MHWLAYLCWPIAVLHGLGTGTDAGTWWLRGTAAGCVAVVAAAVVWRLSPRFARFPQRVARRVLEEVR